MKTIFRNFLSLLKRFKIATILNIVGLSMAFAAFIVMMIQVKFEYCFDRCHPNADYIFRVDLIKGGNQSSTLPRAFADRVMTSSPHIKQGSIITPINKWMEDKYVTVGDGEQSNGFKVPFMTCYPGITHIFGFQFAEGDSDCLKDPKKAIIPKSMAQRMFGNESAVGKQLHLKEYIWTKGDKDEAARFEKDFNKTFDFSPLGNNQEVSISLMPLSDPHGNHRPFGGGLPWQGY